MSDLKATPGPWTAFNMVHEETGARMTPEEVGEYVANCMRLRPECDDFLFVSADTPEGERDVCHIGNGPSGPYNAALIAAAPELYEALDYVAGFAWAGGKTFRDHPAVKAALAKARGETS